MGIRKEQKETRKNEILAAGLDLFIRRGYSSTKINDIANQVGMSTGLLFHYFESKEKLYEELIRNGIEGPMSIMANSGMEPIAFFETTAKMVFYNIISRPSFAKYFVLMNHALYNEAAPQNVKNMLKDYDIYTPTSELIKKGQENGAIRQGNPYALAMAYWCAIQGVAEQMAVNPDYPCPESEWIVDIIRSKG